MANKKRTKKAVKKKGGVLAVLAALLAGLFGVGWYLGWFDEFLKEEPEPAPPVVVDTDELSIHFLELGCWYTGDSTYIKIGDTDVLIDAGAKRVSATTVGDYIEQYCTDGKLEYVIATHAHEDHIAGFVGDSTHQGIFDRFEIGTIIEFAQTESTSKIYQDYVKERDEAVARGAQLYTALQCYDKKDGAQRIYQLAEGVELEILYQKYYEEDASTENNYSVCCMINQGNNHYLFTGDLESDGEKSLVETNNLPHCVLYKAGHHGSKTSSTDKLLSEITPEVVCVCCCAGSDEYTTNDQNTFPTQTFCTNVSAYTDKVYVTSLSVDNENKVYAPMNGNIVFKSKGSTYSVVCSNNDTLLKDTEWFKQHRVWGETD
ncbi:MAG: MBL fold metallo-hydrolase [Clostridia bacterium]|nr:MBL fold metallo-hydrolase [Clostridia bacterium]